MYVFLLSSSTPVITVSIAKASLETLEDICVFLSRSSMRQKSIGC